jgi:hypothetical protein
MDTPAGLTDLTCSGFYSREIFVIHGPNFTADE